MRLSLSAVVAVMGMIVFVGSAPARTALPDQQKALAGVHHAVKKGWVVRSDAARYRNTINRAAALIRRLPKSRRNPLAANLHQVAQIASKLTKARAAAVLGQLGVNNTYFVRKGPPSRETDIVDADGVVYRYMSGLGFVFHPLANFGALNAKVAGGTLESTRRLAQALVERGVWQKGGGIGWEYYFNYSGGKAPWLSGMAQAVAAQALAGAAQRVEADSPKLTATARAAYLSIPGRLVLRRSSGPWIRLYGFNRLVVLNAQLQAAISLRDYANANLDGDAAALASAMEQAVATDLHHFDTGYWTYYSLPRNPSPISYQSYVVRLLRKLDSADPRLATVASRFAGYAKQPPAFKLAAGGPGTAHFWLSKPATVELRSAAGKTKRLTLHGGWYKLGWKSPARAGAYSVLVEARDWAGNRASFSGLPVVRVVPAAVWSVAGSSVSQTKSIRDAAEAGVASHLVATTTTPSIGLASFSAGTGLDSATQTSLATDLGFNAVRLTVAWKAGATAPDASTVNDLRSVPATRRLIVELATETLPVDATERSQLEAFVGSLVEQVPGIGELLLGPAPTVANASLYEAALVSLYDAVKARSSTIVAVGLLDGAQAPGSTLTALANAYYDSGREAPIMAELAFRPAPKGTKNAWTIGNYPQLVAALTFAFDDTDQAGATLPILLDGIAVETTIPAEKLSLYPSPPGPVPGVGEPAQKYAYNEVLQTAACMPNVAGVILRRLVDRAGSVDRAGDQAGLLYADGSAKTSTSSVGETAALAGRGALKICPGYEARVAAKTLVYPLSFSKSVPPWLALSCTRDCAYLVTLERADGKPVRAKRGILRGDTVATVRLSGSSAFPASSGYHLRLRLVAQVNPGSVYQYRSPKIAGS